MPLCPFWKSTGLVEDTVECKHAGRRPCTTSSAAAGADADLSSCPRCCRNDCRWRGRAWPRPSAAGAAVPESVAAGQEAQDGLCPLFALQDSSVPVYWVARLDGLGHIACLGVQTRWTGDMACLGVQTRWTGDMACLGVQTRWTGIHSVLGGQDRLVSSSRLI
jgi:hypothetical protein